MKRTIAAGIMSLAFTLNAFAEDQTPVVPQSYPGPHEAASNVYTKLFENERVRVSEIKFNPGDKAPMHTHAYDHYVYVIEPGTLTLSHPDGTSQTVAAEAGQVLWMPAETHEAVNTGTTVLRATVSELKQ